MTESSPSDDGLQGIRIQVRVLLGGPAEQRFDVDGNEILQMRGHVVDARKAHPQVVVRFGGQRRAELYHWAGPNKHLGVDGFLEVKHWQADGKPHVALLVEAVSVFPLENVDLDHARAGIYAVRGRTGAPVAPRATKHERVAQMRQLLDKADD